MNFNLNDINSILNTHSGIIWLIIDATESALDNRELPSEEMKKIHVQQIAKRFLKQQGTKKYLKKEVERFVRTEIDNAFAFIKERIRME